MRQIIVSEWISLDGVFDAGSMEQWFNPYHSESRAQYLQQVIDNCSAMLYGRHTYEMLYPYWSQLRNNEMGVADKMNTVAKHVVSATLKTAAWQHTSIIDGNVPEQVAALKQQEGAPILVQGSRQLVHALLQAGLVDELKLLLHPHVMGSGARLWETIGDFGLVLKSTDNLDKGLVALSYMPTQ